MSDSTYRQLAESILVAHQQMTTTSSCLCGWDLLGKSWPAHVAKVLDDAGALRTRPPERGERRG